MRKQCFYFLEGDALDGIKRVKQSPSVPLCLAHQFRNVIREIELGDEAGVQHPTKALKIGSGKTVLSDTIQIIAIEVKDKGRIVRLAHNSVIGNRAVAVER